MSILIRGMEMPTSCYKCNLRRRDRMDIVCPVAHERFSVSDVNILDYRLANCPLVPVPPHGRLIDADALEEILLKVIDINASIEQRNEATEQERRCLWWFEQQIGIAPTIIPAEEGET